MVGESDGCDVGRADTVGLELIEGTADGEDDGADDTVGFELIEGLPVGDSEGDADGYAVGESDIEGVDVGVLVDSATGCGGTLIPSTLDTTGSVPPSLLLSDTRFTNVSLFPFESNGSLTISSIVVSSPAEVLSAISKSYMNSIFEQSHPLLLSV